MRSRILISAAALALCLSAAAQQIYRWVDDDGVVHYSDQPPPDATQERTESIELEVPPGFRDPSRAISRGEPVRQRRTNDADDDNLASGAYRRGTITAPAADEVLWNIATQLPVSMRLEPTLAGSHQVQWLLDGNPIGEPTRSLSTTLTPVYRGQHTLGAEILTQDGQTVFVVTPVTFYVQQTTVFRR